MRELVFRMVAENPTWGEELRCRMPELRKQQRANEAELQSLEMTAVDPTRKLRLVETLAEFRTRLRARGNVLEVAERQRVVRLLVQEILVGRDNITIRHSIPLPASSPDPSDGVRPSREPPEPNTGSCYLLRSNSLQAGAGKAFGGRFPRVVSNHVSPSEKLGRGAETADRFRRNVPERIYRPAVCLVLDYGLWPLLLDGLTEPQFDACTAALEAKHLDHFL